MSERIRSIRSATPTAAGKQSADEALQTLLDGFQPVSYTHLRAHET